MIDRRIECKDNGVTEVGVDAKTGKNLVATDPRYFRPTEVDILIGDPSKAKKKLEWSHTVSFKELITEMVEHDFITGRNINGWH